MRRRSRSYSPPPRRGRDGRDYGGRSRRSPSPSRGRHRGDPPTSLLVRNIPRDCRRSEDLRIPFERYGVVKDVYLPKDYYTGEPRGFGFVQYMDPSDAAEAQYHMDHQIINGREITVVFAEENRKKPQEMRSKERSRGRSGYGGSSRRRSPGYVRSFSRSPRHSRSPRRERPSRHSRSITPLDRGHERSPSPVRRSSQHRGRKHSHSPPPARNGPSHSEALGAKSASPPAHYKDPVHAS
jgi:FUS-interacting serine-arginine-rich protein 1